jgi:hypothetical protein
VVEPVVDLVNDRAIGENRREAATAGPDQVGLAANVDKIFVLR